MKRSTCLHVCVALEHVRSVGIKNEIQPFQGRRGLIVVVKTMCSYLYAVKNNSQLRDLSRWTTVQ